MLAKALHNLSILILIFYFEMLMTSSAQDLCSNSSATCIISQYNNFTSNFSYVNPNGSVTIYSSNLTCSSLPCYFNLNASSIVIQSSTLYFSEFHFEASSITMQDSLILSNGTQTGGLGSPPDASSGVSYAGQGGSCFGPANNLQYGSYDTVYNDSNVSLTFGSGNILDHINSFGGGKIVLVTYSNLTIQQTIFNASGLGNCSSSLVVNGGSGGYVWIESYSNKSQADISGLMIDVSGGQGCKNTGVDYGFGGSGGRVVLVGFSSLNAPAVNISGGINYKTSNICTNGAAGTFYITEDRNLTIKNHNISTNCWTMLPSFINESQLVISESALVSFEESDEVIVNVSGLSLKQAGLQYLNPPGSFLIETVTVNLANSSQISILANLSNITSCVFSVDTTSSVLSYNQFIYVTSLAANGTGGCSLNFNGNLVQLPPPKPNLFATNATLTILSLALTSFSLQGTNKINFDQTYLYIRGSGSATFSLSKVVSTLKTCLQDQSPPLLNPLLLSSDLYSDSTLNLSDFISTVAPGTSSSPDALLDFTLTNIAPIYTMFLFIEDTIQLDSTTIEAARLGIFARNISLDSSSGIKSTGLGCSQGKGAGLINSEIAGFCPGSGGSFGGLGGPGTSNQNTKISQTICDSMIGAAYGTNSQWPMFEGSGGGGVVEGQLGGIGGGLIVIGTKIAFINGGVEAGGLKGSVPTTSTAGSGSGGSIQLHTLTRLKGSGSVTAIGGPPGSSGPISTGGYGGGGRIYINCLTWSEINSGNLAQAELSNLNFSVASGDNSGNEPSFSRGSLSSTVCPPGFYGLNCIPCPVGTYKADFGNGGCISCSNKLGDSDYTQASDTSFLCQYECSSGLVDVSKNPNCLSNFFYYTSYVGGVYGVVAASVLVLVLIIFILKKNVFQEKFLKNIERQKSTDDSENLPNLARLHSGELSLKSPRKIKSSFNSSEPWKVLSKEDSFLLEDLPYLKHRLYLKGSNTPYNPWFLCEEPPNEIRNQVDKKDYLFFAQELNKNCIFSINWVILLDCLLLIYAPLYLLLLRFLQRRVVKRLQTFLKQSDYNFWSVMRCRIFPFSMKISASKDYMWGAVEIMDYKKEFDDWQSKDLFPFTLVLGGRGSFYHPLSLNLKDPLISGMHLAFHEISNNEGSLDTFELDLGRRATLDKEAMDFLLELNRWSRKIDFGAYQDWFVDQVVQAIKCVDSANISLFNPMGFNAQFLAEITPKPVKSVKPNSKQTTLLQPSLQTVTYLLSQNLADFDLGIIRHIHRTHHYDSTTTIQFLLKITYKDQNKKESIFINKEKRNSGHMRSSLDSSMFPSERLDTEQLKRQLFERLEHQGRFNESPKEMANNEEGSLSPEYSKLKNPSQPLKRKFTGQVKRLLKFIRYLLLGYRQRILQKYALIGIIASLLICDMALNIMILVIGDSLIWLVNLPFPLALYAVPIGELIWITGSSSIPMGKILLTLNLMAFIDILVGLAANELFTILWPLLLVKILTGIFGCQYVSYMDNMKVTFT